MRCDMETQMVPQGNKNRTERSNIISDIYKDLTTLSRVLNN